MGRRLTIGLPGVTAAAAGILVLLCAAPGFGQSGKIAILYSENSRTWFGLKFPDCATSADAGTYQGKSEFDRYYAGWMWVLNASGLTADSLTDAQITSGKLGNYRVLILSNAVSLGDDEIKAIHDWVQKGGRLLATFGSGYSDVILSASQLDEIQNLQDGGTNGLHNLWHDPLTKASSSQVMYPDNPGANLWVTQPKAGPTTEVGAGFLTYGALANILVQRPPGFNDAYAFLMLNGSLSDRPAVLSDKASKGLVVYFSVAPEYMVALVHKLPGIPKAACDYSVPDTSWWWTSAAQGTGLMMSAINYLLNN